MVTFPPLAEQRAIAEILDCEVSAMMRFIDKVYGGISRLEEYRSALIDAAVTGKIDVRDEVPSG